MKLLTLLTILFMVVSCTDNSRARNYGGTETVHIESNERFINIAWKDNDLWVVTQDTITGIYYAKEKSSLGIMEGQIIITPQTIK